MSLEDKKACIQVVIPTKYESKAIEAGLIYDEMEKKWSIPIKSKVQYTYLQVPYNEKDLVKESCLWNKERKQWYTFDFMKHLTEKYDENRIYLNVPFDDKDDVKANGGRWDSDKKQWFTYAFNTYLVGRFT